MPEMGIFWANGDGVRTKIAFFITSRIGLILNEVLTVLFRFFFGEDAVVLTFFDFKINMYMVNKILATLLVSAWNFYSKRAVLKLQ